MGAVWRTDSSNLAPEPSDRMTPSTSREFGGRPRQTGGQPARTTVPTGLPASASVMRPGTRPFTTWISVTCLAVAISSITSGSTGHAYAPSAASSVVVMVDRHAVDVLDVDGARRAVRVREQERAGVGAVHGDLPDGRRELVQTVGREAAGDHGPRCREVHGELVGHPAAGLLLDLDLPTLVSRRAVPIG
jgi:hypothetical protein